MRKSESTVSVESRSAISNALMKRGGRGGWLKRYRLALH